MKTNEFLFRSAEAGKQHLWPVVAVYDYDLGLGGLVAALKQHGAEVLQLADERSFAEFAKAHAVDVAIVHCGQRGVAALKLCEEIRASARGFFLPILLLTPDTDETFLNFARLSSADLVLASSGSPDRIVSVAQDLLRKPRHRGPWTMLGWMAVNARDKKAASSGLPIAMHPVPFEIYHMIMERPEATHSLADFADRVRNTVMGHAQPATMSKVVTSIRRAFERKDEMFPLRTIYRQGYRLELGARINPERYNRKPRSRLFVGTVYKPRLRRRIDDRHGLT